MDRICYLVLNGSTYDGDPIWNRTDPASNRSGANRVKSVPQWIQFQMDLNISHPVQAILGENFSQSEYVAVGAIFQFAFLTLTRSDPSCVPLCKSFEHSGKQAFLFINLSNVSFFIVIQSVRILMSF